MLPRNDLTDQITTLSNLDLDPRQRIDEHELCLAGQTDEFTWPRSSKG